MALRAYTPERREVKAEGQVLGEVRGLSLEAIGVLVREHMPDLEAIVDLFDQKDGAKALGAQDWMTLALPLVTQAPGLVANVIALAGEEPQAAPDVMGWPASAQLSALVNIFQLTFSEIGEVKKAWEIVAALRRQAKATTGNTKTLGTKAK